MTFNHLKMFRKKHKTAINIGLHTVGIEPTLGKVEQF
jgi:hypothetical protein